MQDIKRTVSTVFIFTGVLFLSGCGGGSTDSGAGGSPTPGEISLGKASTVRLDAAPVIPPGGIVALETPGLITQSGSYQLQFSNSLTDIVIICEAADVDATAIPVASVQVPPSTARCVNSNVRMLDHPPGGGTLIVEFNAGNEITAYMTTALSITSGGNR